MRNAFADELTKLANDDPRVMLFSGDIGNRLFDTFKAEHGKRFLNCGVAEANMISMAAGAAMSGMRPICYTITPFVTTRCLEQIRVDVCYHEQPVVIVGVGAGLSYASLGATHHACEDISLLRSLPGMKVVSPADAPETRAALRAAIASDTPTYIRIGKKNEPVVHETSPEFTIGKGIVLRDGSEICILSNGVLLPTALEAADQLEKQGASLRVVSFHTVKPLDETMLEDVFARFDVVVTLEEHSLIGGLGSAVAEWLSDREAQRARLCRIGTPDHFPHNASSQASLREEFGLTADAIAKRISAFRKTIAS